MKMWVTGFRFVPASFGKGRNVKRDGSSCREKVFRLSLFCERASDRIRASGAKSVSFSACFASLQTFCPPRHSTFFYLGVCFIICRKNLYCLGSNYDLHLNSLEQYFRALLTLRRSSLPLLFVSTLLKATIPAKRAQCSTRCPATSPPFMKPALKDSRCSPNPGAPRSELVLAPFLATNICSG
ncbi:uncharacterized protein LY89DRAFT_64372 [Mollisia scopiformis]|uniref:Uncharacterized protein n=1 Tax=Mollisia scopiformis TaxID=149040 RepID=A0A194X9F9_MOLSC|nr:uncharacterized protein LY89DRAFT_64372 [Mollisia scopiformis]KUJ16801.1 hypothetical protein LY89DRAFT_64372 [Mollisia scopiformis]